MRLVLDTNVVIAAMRSPGGASSALLQGIRLGRATALLSVPMALEYEAKCTQAQHHIAAGLSHSDSVDFVMAVIALAEPVKIHYLWRPRLKDPNDEMVLEVAVNGNADAIVTFNQKDYGVTPGEFGIEVLLPREVIRRI